MADTPFSKLNLKVNEEVKTVKWNDQEVKVKQYLPVAEKLQLITNVANECVAEDSSFANPVKVDIFGSLEIAQFYTDIAFAQEDKDDPAASYDLLDSSGLLDAIVEAIPSKEYDFIINGIDQSIASIYTYKNSAMGIMENVTKNYKDVDMDAEEIKNKISDPENLTLLKDVLTKLG